MKAESKKNYTRRRILIDKSTQTRFLLLPILSVVLNSIFFLGILWYAIRTVSVNGTPAGISYYVNIILMSLLVILINLGVVIFLGMIASNHFIGPLYRLKKSIDSLVKGSYGQKITFRENDLKFRLGQIYNELSLVLQERVEDDMDFADRMKEKLREISVDSSKESAHILKEIDLELENFKKIKLQYLMKD